MNTNDPEFDGLMDFLYAELRRTTERLEPLHLRRVKEFEERIARFPALFERHGCSIVEAIFGLLPPVDDTSDFPAALQEAVAERAEVIRRLPGELQAALRYHGEQCELMVATRRELVHALWAQKLSDQEIADRIGVSLELVGSLTAEFRPPESPPDA